MTNTKQTKTETHETHLQRLDAALAAARARRDEAEKVRIEAYATRDAANAALADAEAEAVGAANLPEAQKAAKRLRAARDKLEAAELLARNKLADQTAAEADIERIDAERSEVQSRIQRLKLKIRGLDGEIGRRKSIAAEKERELENVTQLLNERRQARDVALRQYSELGGAP